jgi:hypothetical protein
MPHSTTSSALTATLLILGSFAVAPSDTRADVYATTSAVGIAPTQSMFGTAFVHEDADQGHEYRFVGQMLGTAYADRLRLGAEIELSNYDTELAGLPGIQVKSYNIRARLRVVPFPNSFSPYCGAGLGIDILRFNEDQIESVISDYRVDKFGLAIGGVGFVGVQLPISGNVTLYAEGRAAAAFDLFSAADVEMGGGIYEGFGGMAGLRMRF